MQQPNSLGTMYDMLSEALKPVTDLMELSAFWQDGVRFSKGDKCILTSNHLLDTVNFYKSSNGTHVITKCMGTLSNTKFEISFEDLETKERIIIKL